MVEPEPVEHEDPPSDPAPRSGVVGRAGDAVERATRARDQARRSIPAVDAGLASYERDGQINGFVLAGALAFRFFVFLLPLYLLALVTAGATVAFDPTGPSELSRSAGLSSYLSGTIADAATTSKRSLWILIPVTIYALASAARSAYKVVATAHAAAWGLTDIKRPRSYVAILGFLGFALATMAGLVTFRHLRTGALLPLSIVLSAAYYGALWLAASRLLPRPTGTSIWWLVPGAVLVAVGTQALYVFDVVYLNARVHSASRAYGALGIAASVMLWLYLLGRLMVASPVVNATLWERGQAKRRAATTDGAAAAPPPRPSSSPPDP
jgi:uncharacterized BrkB/YihY/UPF0761 family membrane protein